VEGVEKKSEIYPTRKSPFRIPTLSRFWVLWAEDKASLSMFPRWKKIPTNSSTLSHFFSLCEEGFYEGFDIEKWVLFCEECPAKSFTLSHFVETQQNFFGNNLILLMGDFSVRNLSMRLTYLVSFINSNTTMKHLLQGYLGNFKKIAQKISMRVFIGIQTIMLPIEPSINRKISKRIGVHHIQWEHTTFNEDCFEEDNGHFKH